MRLSDIQPQYFPRLHYFARMLESDVFVIRDDVQFVRNHQYPSGERGVSYQAHTPIKGPQGQLLLAVSVGKGSGLPINRTSICYQQKWRRKHINLIKQHYRSAPQLGRLLPELEALFAHEFPSLGDLNIATTCWGLAHLLGTTVNSPEDLSVERANAWLSHADTPGQLRRVELGSRMLSDSASADASERIVELCELAGADEYLAGGTAVDSYLDRSPFRDHGVAIAVQDWACPPYPQRYTRNAAFLANLSILDFLLNAPEERPRLLLSDEREWRHRPRSCPPGTRARPCPPPDLV